MRVHVQKIQFKGEKQRELIIIKRIRGLSKKKHNIYIYVHRRRTTTGTLRSNREDSEEMVETSTTAHPPVQPPPPLRPPVAGGGPVHPPLEQLHHLHFCIHSNPSWRKLFATLFLCFYFFFSSR